MSRLPTPGSDRGNWGSILNDYLSQSHKSDGTLKDSVVGAGQLQDNAVTTSKLAPGAVTKSTVGLAHVDDTSDADKPISTAVQAALTLKANSADIAGQVSSQVNPVATALHAFLPSYAGSLAKTWNPSLCLYNGESPSLRAIRSLIRKGRTGTRVRLVCAGDSKTSGSGAAQPQVAVNSYPGQLSDLLGAKPGMVYGNTWDTRWSARTNVSDAGNYSQNYFACTGTWSVTFTSLESMTGFKVFAYISPGGTINVSVDGVAQTPMTVTSGSTWKSGSFSGFTDTTHVIILSGTTSASLLGIESTYSTGLTISNAGRPSSSAAEWLMTGDWSRLYASTYGVGNTTISKPDLTVIAIGTNTNTSTLADIHSFIANVAGLYTGAAPLLVVAFGGIDTNGHYNSKRSQLYATADALDVPLVDFTALIGNQSTAAAAGLMQDTAHENTRGYALEADLVARILSY